METEPLLAMILFLTLVNIMFNFITFVVLYSMIKYGIYDKKLPRNDKRRMKK